MERSALRPEFGAGVSWDRHLTLVHRALQLMDLPNASDIFPSDVMERARRYLGAIGSTGAYSDSQGASIFREEIAGALQVCAHHLGQTGQTGAPHAVLSAQSSAGTHPLPITT